MKWIRLQQEEPSHDGMYIIRTTAGNIFHSVSWSTKDRLFYTSIHSYREERKLYFYFVSDWAEMSNGTDIVEENT